MDKIEKMKEYRKKWRKENRPFEIEYQRKRYKLNPRGKPKNNLTKTKLTREKIIGSRFENPIIPAILSRRIMGESIRDIAKTLKLSKTMVGELEKKGVEYIYG